MLSSLGRISAVLGLTALVLMVGGSVLAAPTSQGAVAQPIEPRGNPATLAASTEFTIGLQLVSSGLSAPVHIAHAGDNRGRLFVVQQAGTIRVIKNGVLLSTPYLDITSQVGCCGERGLLSIAFDPDFQGSRTFYLNYTNLSGNTIIERYTVADAAADVANVTSHTIILTINQPESNHNGGQLQFGPNDNYLYIGMGDGGGGGDQHGATGNGQNPGVLLGKMLRINVRGVPTYSIPATNPFTQTVGYRPEIWALGVRNPWRFSFDRSSGDLFIGDVGQDCYEEIDYQPAASQGGQNYGWRRMEGFHAFDPAHMLNCTQPTPTPPDVTLPVAEIAHPDGEAIVGGYVYRGSSFPSIQGVYFFADEVTGRLWSMKHITSMWVVTEQPLPTHYISSFGEDDSGELYVADYNQGAIYKITSTAASDFSASTKKASANTVSTGDSVTYTIVVRNGGGLLTSTVHVTDVVPTGLAFVTGTFTATQGVVDAAGAPTLIWSGTVSSTPVVTLTYAVTVTTTSSAWLVNSAIIDPGHDLLITRTVSIVANPHELFLPLILRGN